MAIIRHLKAIEDLEEISDYLANYSRPAATRFLKAAETTFRRPERFPRLGRRCLFRDPSLSGVRKWRLDSSDRYMVFYRPTDDGIEIVRVFDGTRDISRLLGKEIEEE